MPGEADGQMLHALRDSRYWDEHRMARELRKAAVSIGEPVAEHEALVKQIKHWEKGTRQPSERYLQLYRRVFPGDWPVNGSSPHSPPDPAAVLERARHTPGRDELAALQLAAFRSGRMDLVAFADKLLALQRQVDELAEDLKRGLGEAGQ